MAISCEQNAPDWFHRVLQKINSALSAIRPDNAVKITGGTIDGVTISNATLSTVQVATLSTTQIGVLTVTTLATLPGGGSLLSTTAALTSFSSNQIGTLLNAPFAGNPTKWIAINDAGTTRFLPAW